MLKERIKNYFSNAAYCEESFLLDAVCYIQNCPEYEQEATKIVENLINSGILQRKIVGGTKYFCRVSAQLTARLELHPLDFKFEFEDD